MIGCSNFDCCGEIKDNAILSCSGFAPCGLDGIADHHGKLWLSLGKGLRAVLILELCAIFGGTFLGQFADEFCMSDGKFNCLLFCVAEYDVAEAWTGSI